MHRYRLLIALAAIATALVLVSADANARAGGGFSSGSRGMRTFSAPPATRTAPSTAAPIQRTITQPGAAGPAAPRPGLFGGGLFGGLAAGFLGAGLFDLLLGAAVRRHRRLFLDARPDPASRAGGVGGAAGLCLVAAALHAGLCGGECAEWRGSTNMHAFGGLGSAFGGQAPAGAPLTIDKSDYDAFEQLLGDVQAAYSAEDLAALRAKVTAEMLTFFSEQLAQNASRGLINRVTGVKLLQGDLAEAWREGDADYATVAMHFALTDSMVERASGHRRGRQRGRGHRIMDVPARQRRRLAAPAIQQA